MDILTYNAMHPPPHVLPMVTYVGTSTGPITLQHVQCISYHNYVIFFCSHSTYLKMI